MNGTHLNPTVAQPRGRGKEGNRGGGQIGVRSQPKRGRMEEVGGESWRISLAVWSWRIRGVLPEITLPSVGLDILSLSLVSPIALAMDSELLSFCPDTILPTKTL